MVISDLSSDLQRIVDKRAAQSPHQVATQVLASRLSHLRNAVLDHRDNIYALEMSLENAKIGLADTEAEISGIEKSLAVLTGKIIPE